jgi:hypothetical protein
VSADHQHSRKKRVVQMADPRLFLTELGGGRAPMCSLEAWGIFLLRSLFALSYNQVSAIIFFCTDAIEPAAHKPKNFSL